MPRIYLDHNATSPILPAVADRMAEALRALIGNPSSVHREGQRARAAVEEARRQVAVAVGTTFTQVVFTSGATEANNLALHSLAAGLPAELAVATTVVSFLPVFTMTGAEGKLFKPLAYTKTFALVSAVIIAITLLPALAHLLFTIRIQRRHLRWLAGAVCVAAGGVLANTAIRAALVHEASREGISVRVPPIDLCTDNAAMIAAAGAEHLVRGERDDMALNASPRLSL